MNKKVKIIVINITAIILISIINLLTFTKNEKIINDENLDIAFYEDGNLVKDIPTKNNEENIYFDYGECDNGASVIWNEEQYAPLIKNLTNSNTKCRIYFKQKYVEKILNGAYPIIKDNLIPVIINDDGTVTRADEKEKWYSYSEQKWANAVILNDGVKDPGANNPIAESDIESYFVWIPRYRYEIFDDGNYNGLTSVQDKVQIINIEFENIGTPLKNGSSKKEWLTHPAFTSFNTNGIWVGKFDTGYKDAANTKAAEVNPTSEADAKNKASQVIIKPNEYSWRGIQTGKAYAVARAYAENLNSHSMKNMEWGAVAYLQHSKYGSHESIRNNNNSNYLTGYAALKEPTIGLTNTNELCNTTPLACNEYSSSDKGKDGEYTVNYFNKASVVASTTNNYSGIYDLSGGAWENVMALIEDENGNYLTGRSGLGTDIPLPDSRYFDVYSNSNDSFSFSRGHFGDAIKEMGPFQSVKYGTQTRYISSWYKDEAIFITSNSQILSRGGGYRYGSDSGMFAFATNDGYAYDLIGFRIVLAFN